MRGWGQRIARRDWAPDQNCFLVCAVEGGREDLWNRRERSRQGEVAVVFVDGVERT